MSERDHGPWLCHAAHRQPEFHSYITCDPSGQRWQQIINTPGVTAPGHEAFVMSSQNATELSDLDVRRRRALYRAEHRGTKEMDWLLGRYAVAKLPEMDASQLTHFEQLLAISDPELHSWIIKPDALIDTTFERAIYDIRAFHDLKFATNA